MRSFLQSRNVWLTLLLWGGFWPIAWLVPKEILFDIVYSLSIAGCGAVVVTFLPSVFRFFFRNDLDGKHYLVIGVVSLLGITALRHAWSFAYHLLDEPNWMPNHVFVAWTVFALFTTACMVLMARDVEQGQIPRENWRALGAVVGFAGFLTLVFVSLTVDELEY